MNAAQRTADVPCALGATAALRAPATRSTVLPAHWNVRWLDGVPQLLRRLAWRAARSGRETHDGADARHPFTVFMSR